MAKEKKQIPNYINAPLHIFQNFQKEPVETIEKFIIIGVHRFATKINYTTKEVLRQLFYGYIYKKEHLTDELIEFVSEILERWGLKPTSGYFDFDNNIFDVDMLVESEISRFLKSGILQLAITHYQLEQAKKILGISFGNDYSINTYRRFEQENNVFTSRYGKDASVSLTTNMLFEFKKEEKKPFELDLFCAYVAIKSIQGSSEYCKTNKAFIKMRMLGAKSKKVLAESLRISENKGFYKRIDNRYQIGKLLDGLLEHGFLQSKIGRDRYIYASTQLSFDLLPQAIAAANTPKILKEQERAAKELLNRLLSPKTAP